MKPWQKLLNDLALHLHIHSLHSNPENLGDKNSEL